MAIGPAPGGLPYEAEEPWPALTPRPGQLDRHPRPVRRPPPRFTRTAQAAALVVCLTAAAMCFGPLWGLENPGWLFLQVPGALLALVLAGVGIGAMPRALPHPGARRLVVTLAMGGAEAGLLLFAAGALPPLSCFAIGVIPFLIGAGIVLDKDPGDPWS